MGDSEVAVAVKCRHCSSQNGFNVPERMLNDDLSLECGKCNKVMSLEDNTELKDVRIKCRKCRLFNTFKIPSHLDPKVCDLECGQCSTILEFGPEVCNSEQRSTILEFGPEPQLKEEPEIPPLEKPPQSLAGTMMSAAASQPVSSAEQPVSSNAPPVSSNAPPVSSRSGPPSLARALLNMQPAASSAHPPTGRPPASAPNGPPQPPSEVMTPAQLEQAQNIMRPVQTAPAAQNRPASQVQVQQALSNIGRAAAGRQAPPVVTASPVQRAELQSAQARAPVFLAQQAGVPPPGVPTQQAAQQARQAQQAVNTVPVVIAGMSVRLPPQLLMHIKEWETTLLKQATEIQTLRGVNQQGQLMVRNLNATVYAMNQKNSEFMSKIESYEKEKKETAAVINKLADEKNRLAKSGKQQLKAKDRTAKQSREQQLATQQLMADVAKNSEALSSELKRTKQTTANQEKRYQILSSKYSQAIAELSSKTAEMENLQKHSASLRQSNIDLVAARERELLGHSETRARMEELESEVKRAAEEREKLLLDTIAVPQLKMDLETAEKRLKDQTKMWESERNTYSDAIKRLEKRVEALDDEIAEKRQIINKNDKSSVSLQRKVSDLKRQHASSTESLRTCIREKDARIETLMKNLEEMKIKSSQSDTAPSSDLLPGGLVVSDSDSPRQSTSEREASALREVAEKRSQLDAMSDRVEQLVEELSGKQQRIFDGDEEMSGTDDIALQDSFEARALPSIPADAPTVLVDWKSRFDRKSLQKRPAAGRRQQRKRRATTTTSSSNKRKRRSKPVSSDSETEESEEELELQSDSELKEPEPEHQSDDGHDDQCSVCVRGTESESDPLLMCDACVRVFHLRCVDLGAVPEGEWKCAYCVAPKKLSNACAYCPLSFASRSAARVHTGLHGQSSIEAAGKKLDAPTSTSSQRIVAVSAKPKSAQLPSETTPTEMKPPRRSCRFSRMNSRRSPVDNVSQSATVPSQTSSEISNDTDPPVETMKQSRRSCRISSLNTCQYSVYNVSRGSSISSQTCSDTLIGSSTSVETVSASGIERMEHLRRSCRISSLSPSQSSVDSVSRSISVSPQTSSDGPIDTDSSVETASASGVETVKQHRRSGRISSLNPSQY
eukprot:133898_1